MNETTDQANFVQEHIAQARTEAVGTKKHSGIPVDAVAPAPTNEVEEPGETSSPET